MRRRAQAGLRRSECWQDRGNQVSIWAVPYQSATDVSKGSEWRASCCGLQILMDAHDIWAEDKGYLRSKAGATYQKASTNRANHRNNAVHYDTI